jgi:hypothetical protein
MRAKYNLHLPFFFTAIVAATIVNKSIERAGFGIKTWLDPRTTSALAEWKT